MADADPSVPPEHRVDRESSRRPARAGRPAGFILTVALLAPIIAISSLIAASPGGHAALGPQGRPETEKVEPAQNDPSKEAAAASADSLGPAASSGALNSDASIVIPADQMKFYTNAQGFVVANAWGNPADGAHSNFIRMNGRSASGPHIHSFSYYGVVISGTVSNERVGNNVARALGPGSYWYQQGREPHVTKCESRGPCLFFVTSSGSFDYLPAS